MKLKNNKENVEIYDNNLLVGKIPNSIFELLKVYFKNYDKLEIISIFDKIFNGNGEKIKNLLDIRYKNFFRLNISNINSHNTNINLYNDIIYLDRIKSFEPESIVIVLNNNCFCNCRYCYAGAGVKDTCEIKQMDLLLFEKIVKELINFNIGNIDFTGGDILLHTDINNIFDICARNSIKFCFSTKKKLTKSDLKLIESYKSFINYIQISIDSIIEDEQNKLIDKKNYLNIAIKNISDLIKLGINVRVNSVVTSFNINSIIDLSFYLKKMGVNKHVYSPYANNLKNHNKIMFPSCEQYENLRNLLDQNRDLEGFIEKPIFLTNCEEKEYTSCQAGLTGLVINFEGDVFVCERLSVDKEYSIGNLKEKTIREIWNSKDIEKFSFPNRELFKNSDCYDCSHFDDCIRTRGICFVHSLLINKSLYGKDNNCKIYTDRERIF